MTLSEILQTMFARAKSPRLIRATLLLSLAYFATGAATVALENRLALDVSGTAVANNALMRFAVWFVEITILAVYLQRTLTQSNPKGFLRIAALLALCALGVAAFIIVVASPLLHLSIIMRLNTVGFYLLFALTFLPLFIWFANYLMRMLTLIPEWAHGQTPSLRDGLHQTESHIPTLLRAEILLLAALGLIGAIEAHTIGWGRVIAHGAFYAIGALILTLLLQSLSTALPMGKIRDHVLV